MRDLLIRLTATALVLGGHVVLASSPSYAGGGTTCTQTNPYTGLCVTAVHVPTPSSAPGSSSASGPKDTGSGSGCYWDGTSQGISKPPPGPVPCTSKRGYWSNSYHCYISILSPQPAAGNPEWQGHQPGDGAVYNCSQPQTGMLITIWAPGTPPNSGAGPTPRTVAQVAVKRMNLTAIEIGIAPKPGPNSVGLVGMPVWMWASRPRDHSVGPISATASAGGITIKATAKLLRVTWDMGDGSRVVCNGAGTPYRISYGRRDSPDCGHVYQRSSWNKPHQQYVVTATSAWVVTWSGAGQTGTIRLGGLTRSTRITIGEAQVLVD